MKTRTTLLVTVAMSLLSAPAVAAGSGDHSHDEMAIGQPGKVSKVRRNIDVVMKETDDGAMIFEPKTISVRKGETVRLRVRNAGELEHEFVMDEADKNEAHKALMQKFPEMEHDDPNAVRLAPGERGEIIWTFTNTGEFEFACLIPGHYESGMHGPLKVAAK